MHEPFSFFHFIRLIFYKGLNGHTLLSTLELYWIHMSQQELSVPQHLVSSYTSCSVQSWCSCICSLWLTCVSHFQVFVSAITGVSKLRLAGAYNAAVFSIASLTNFTCSRVWTVSVLDLRGRPLVRACVLVTTSVDGTVDDNNLPIITLQLRQRVLTNHTVRGWEAGEVGLQIFIGAIAGIRRTDHICVQFTNALPFTPFLQDVHSSFLRAFCVRELLWRSALTAGLTVCSPIQHLLHKDHSGVTAEAVDIVQVITGNHSLCGNIWNISGQMEVSHLQELKYWAQ